jgi:hypothetical protein
MPDMGGRGSAVAAFGLTLAGLAVVYHGLTGASPVLWTYTEEGLEKAREGRAIIAAGAVVLGGAAALVAARGRRRRAILVALPGVACLALALVFRPGDGAWAWIAFLPLAPLAVIAAWPGRLASRAR